LNTAENTALAPTPTTRADRPKVIIVANTSWYLYNFGGSLLRALLSADVRVISLAPYDEFSRKLEQLGMQHLDLRMGRRSLNAIADLALSVRLWRTYLREQPDIVFHNTIKPVIYGSLAARIANVPRVVNMITGLGYIFTRNGVVQRILRPLVKVMYRYALKKSDTVLFQNPDDKRYFERHGLVDGLSSAITYGSGVDLEHFYFVEPRKTNEACTFLFVGRILRDKGVVEFVEAASKVKRDYPMCSFKLLGRIDKDNPTQIKEHSIDKWTKAGCVEYLGEVEDVRYVLEKADVVVLPSYREGVPRALLEAMAMGKAIITTDTPGCRETVINGQNGILVPPREVDPLAEAMIRMIRDPEMRARMGREGRRLAVELFDVKRVIKQILSAMNIPSGPV